MSKNKENASPEEAEAKKSSGLTNVLVIIMALIFVAMSSLMIFVPGIKTLYLCYAICIAGIIAGISMIIRYFMTDAYRNVNAYGFSGGILAIILGVCGILKVAQMELAFLTILGIIILLSGIIILQHSLDLRRMKDSIWGFILVIAAIILACAVIVILQPMAEQFGYDAYIWWMVLVSGSLSFIINIYTMIKVSLFKKKEKKLAEEEEARKAALEEEEKQLSQAAEEKRKQIADAVDGNDETVIIPENQISNEILDNAVESVAEEVKEDGEV